ncbi:hypothetical protein SM139_3321, partial [Stenotrophomonas maltophilia]
ARPSASRQAWPRSSWGPNCRTTHTASPNWSSAHRTSCRTASAPLRRWTMRSAIAWGASAMTSAASAKSVRNSKRCSARPPTSRRRCRSSARAWPRKPALPKRRCRSSAN